MAAMISRKRLHVATLVECFSQLTETFIYDQVCALAATGVRVDVLTMWRRNSRTRPFERVQELTARRRWRHGRTAERITSRIAQHTGWAKRPHQRYVRSLSECLSELQPQVLHAHFGPMGVFSASVAIRNGIPAVVSFHGYDATVLGRQRRWQVLYQQLFRDAALLTVPSKSLGSRLAALGAPLEKIRLLHYGVDLNGAPFSDPSMRYGGGPVRFLAVGRLIPKKDPIGLLRAFATCVEAVAARVETELTIVGDGPLSGAVDDEVCRLGVSEKVRRLGPLPHKRVLELMATAHIFVQHSVTAPNGDEEGLPVSLTEAAAAGLPVVTTRHSGIPELVKEGSSGFLVDERDYAAMGLRMADLACRPESWSELGRCGRSVVMKEFDRHVVSRQAMEIFNKAVAGND